MITFLGWALWLGQTLGLISPAVKLIQDPDVSEPAIKPKGQIRFIRVTDFDALIALEKLVCDEFKEKPAFTDERGIRAFCVSPDRYAWVIEFMGVLVGYIVFDKMDDSLQITRICVHPDYRRRGLGKNMIQYVHGLLPNFKRTKLTFLAPDNRMDLHLFLSSDKVGFKGFTRKKYELPIPPDMYAFVHKASLTDPANT